jgi:hypothetical protein
MFALAALFKAQHLTLLLSPIGALCFCRESMGIEEVACQVPYFIYNSLPPQWLLDSQNHAAEKYGYESIRAQNQE